MEGAATTVYAQGGRGNSRLVAWEGERTVTFTMEDALISPTGFMILSGAGLTEANGDDSNAIIVHSTEIVSGDDVVLSGESPNQILTIKLTGTPYTKTNEDLVYVMLLDDNGEVISEPYIPTVSGNTLTIDLAKAGNENVNGRKYTVNDASKLVSGCKVLVDYYTKHTTKARQIDITPDKFGGNYYLEASTLFRTTDGVDMPAEFIIPNCKIQSNFTFTMASTGDPSSFTFTMDAFPDYTRFNDTKKVLAAIQIIGEGTGEESERRAATKASGASGS